MICAKLFPQSIWLQLCNLPQARWQVKHKTALTPPCQSSQVTSSWGRSNSVSHNSTIRGVLQLLPFQLLCKTHKQKQTQLTWVSCPGPMQGTGKAGCCCCCCCTCRLGSGRPRRGNKNNTGHVTLCLCTAEQQDRALEIPPQVSLCCLKLKRWNNA